MDKTIAGWRKASYSNGQASCVEVGHAAVGVLVRDTKTNGQGPELAFTPGQWRRFTTELRGK